MGQEVRALREAAGISVEELAARSRGSVRGIERVEAGYAPTRFTDMVPFASVLGDDYQRLLKVSQQAHVPELRCAWGTEATRVLDLLHATATGVHTVAGGARPFTLFVMPEGPDVVFHAHLAAAFFTEDLSETCVARNTIDALPADM
ncbi:helix-turn-helix domain-containing protein [Saccharothrix sp. CB00851]|uniref:helix-turn-helix domain-containing protein n=1 Tax=Saccharothrix sp. CB00851 TaxID=1835005 RepID=UPI0023786A48|nr:helix-turn-helix transcriptional regulator [Saccharothrix sp. CB00851]